MIRGRLEIDAQLYGEDVIVEFDFDAGCVRVFASRTEVPLRKMLELPPAAEAPLPPARDALFVALRDLALANGELAGAFNEWLDEDERRAGLLRPPATDDAPALQLGLLRGLVDTVRVLEPAALDSAGNCAECGEFFPHRGTCSRSVQRSGEAWVPPRLVDEATWTAPPA